MVIHSNGPARRAGRLAMAGATVAALGMIAAPAWAQTTKPLPNQPAAATASTAFADGAAYCLNAVDDIENADATLVELGWETEGGILELGPNQVTLNASKLGDPLGDLHYYASVESYQSTLLVYCTYSVEGATTGLDIAAGAEEFGLEGAVEDVGDARYGSWELFLEDQVFLVLAEQHADYFYLQITWIGTTPDAGG